MEDEILDRENCHRERKEKKEDGSIRMDKKSQFVVVAFPAEPNTVQNLDIRMSIWHCAFTAHRTSFNTYWILTQPRVFRSFAILSISRINFITYHLWKSYTQIVFTNFLLIYVS